MEKYMKLDNYLDRTTHLRKPWGELNELAREYRRIMKKTRYGKSVQSRSPRQKEIVDKIINATLHYFVSIAKQLKYGRYDKKKQKFTGLPLDIADNYVLLKRPYLTIDDLTQEGILNVYGNFHKYNPDKSSLQQWIWIYSISGMLKGNDNMGFMLRVPPHQVYGNRKLANNRNRSRFIDNVGSRLTQLPDNLSKYQMASLIYLSLTNDYVELSGIDEQQIDNTALETILRNGPNSPTDELLRRELRDITSKVLMTLTPREEAVIKMRFGIEYEEMTLEEVGKRFEVTRDRIRQIEAKALRKLRHPSRRRLLREFL